MENFKVMPVAEEDLKCIHTVDENCDQADAGHTNASLNNGFYAFCQNGAFYEEVKLKIGGQSQAIGLEVGPRCRLEGNKLESPGSLEPNLSSFGVKITEVTKGSFADTIGMRKNDKLFEVGGKWITSKEEALEAFSSSTDQNLKLTIQRYETTTNEIKCCKISPKQGTIVTEIIEIFDCDAITKSKSICGALDLDNEVGSEQVYLKSSGPDRSLYLAVENKTLLLKRNIHPDNLNKLALFNLYRYLDLCFTEYSEYEPVVIQHKESGLCVQLDNDAVLLTEIPNLEKVPYNSPFMFRRKVIDHNQNVAFFRTINKKKVFISFGQNKAEGSVAIARHSPGGLTMYCS